MSKKGRKRKRTRERIERELFNNMEDRHQYYSDEEEKEAAIYNIDIETERLVREFLSGKVAFPLD